MKMNFFACICLALLSIGAAFGAMTDGFILSGTPKHVDSSPISFLLTVIAIVAGLIACDQFFKFSDKVKTKNELR